MSGIAERSVWNSCDTIEEEGKMDRINVMMRVVVIFASLPLLSSGIRGVGLSTRLGEVVRRSTITPSEKMTLNDFTHTVFMEKGTASW